MCVHALPQAVTGVGKQVFHRPRGPVGAGIPPVDQDLPHVPNPVDNQGREGRLSTGGCGQPWGGVGEGAWGQSWGQSGDNLVRPLALYRAGVVAHAGAWLPWVFRAAPCRAGAVRRCGAWPPRQRRPARSGGERLAAVRVARCPRLVEPAAAVLRPCRWVLIPAWACAARSGSRPYGRLARAVRPGDPSGPRPYVFRFSPRPRRRRLTTPAGSPYCSEDVRAESRPTPRGSRGSDRAAKPRAARLPIFRPGVHP